MQGPNPVDLARRLDGASTSEGKGRSGSRSLSEEKINDGTGGGASFLR